MMTWKIKNFRTERPGLVWQCAVLGSGSVHLLGSRDLLVLGQRCVVAQPMASTTQSFLLCSGLGSSCRLQGHPKEGR
jgi:hypothetical protein